MNLTRKPLTQPRYLYEQAIVDAGAIDNVGMFAYHGYATAVFFP